MVDLAGDARAPPAPSSPTDAAATRSVADDRAAQVGSPAVEEARIDTDDTDALPDEAREILRLIHARGPFPYDRDGVVFGNYEGRLPKQRRGYYREYTVPTPGLSHRGARRIVTGGEPPREFWYTDDHYESFRRIEATP
ncbi:ribonuclease domain-containing protein [Arenimonas sp.]|uniref:ribonuclease domain-containing protein n=1 Tax=Arenimonas sp. TaxID=1872635 RepID=UPI0039E433A0